MAAQRNVISAKPDVYRLSAAGAEIPAYGILTPLQIEVLRRFSFIYVGNAVICKCVGGACFQSFGCEASYNEPALVILHQLNNIAHLDNTSVLIDL